MRYYLGPYESRALHGDLSAWEAPQGCIASLDLRSEPDQVSPGIALFVMPDDMRLGADFRLIGSGDMRDLKPADRSVFASALRLPTVTGDSLCDWVWDALTVRADPDGATGPRPIMPSSRGMLRLDLVGHGCVRSKRFSAGDPEGAPVVAALQRQYRRLRGEAQAGRLRDSRHHLRVLDYWREKYRADPAIFIPGDLPRERPIPHETTITESFNTADGDVLGPDLSWTELQGDIDIVSNRAQLASVGGSYGGVARADSDLSSDDHYVETTIHSNGSASFRLLMLIARKDSTATLTYYIGYWRYSQDNAQIYRSSGGSYTSIVGPTAVVLNEATTYTAKLECDGSTITQYTDGASTHSTTDTNITGNLRCGIAAYQASSGQSLWHDAFTAADLAAGAAPTLYLHSLIGVGI